MAIETSPISATSVEEDALSASPAGQVRPEAPDEPIAPPSRVVAARYLLQRHVGRGGNGSVYQALDREGQQVVAVKIVHRPSGRTLERIRAEVTALRWLRLPGVVRLLDDGLDDGDYFLAMEMVQGRPFLGRGPFRWEEIAQPVLELLEILARVHLAGVLHRDLKPDNVLLTADGHPVLVDFGIAKGRALSDEGGEGSGTVRYVAPEQAQARPCGVQADLYALGIMLYEALSGGRLPQTATGRRELLQQRVSEDPRPLRSVAPFLPPHVSEVVDRMVARDPRDRPGSALEVLVQLGGRLPAVLDGGLRRVLPADRPATALELRALFDGPDLFVHLPQDAAEVLHLRTGGRPELVVDELALWVRAGLASWTRVEGRERITTDRVAIERLRTGEALAAARQPPAYLSAPARELLAWARRAWPDTHLAVLDHVAARSAGERTAAVAELVEAGLAWELPDGRLGVRPVGLPRDRPEERQAQARVAALLPEGGEARLRHLRAGGAPEGVVLDATRAVLEGLLLDGQHVRAMAVLEKGLSLARSRPGLEPQEEALLVVWAKAAMAQENRAAAERALYEVGRAQVRSAGVDRIERLLLAWRSAMRFEPERAWDLGEELGAFEDDELECWRVAAMLNAAARMGIEERFLAELEAWQERGADPALRRAKRAGWLGNLAYRQSRFDDAARWHAEAVAGKRARNERVAARMNLASALLEAGRLDQAEAEARQVQAEADELRLATFAATASYLQASARYRAGRPVDVRPEALAAAEWVSAALGGVLAVVAAGQALRSGDVALGRTRALQAAAGLARVRSGEAMLLCEVLAHGLGAPSPAGGAPDLRARVHAMRVPGLKIQALAVLRWAEGGGKPPAHELALHPAWPTPDPLLRRELLSLHECRQPQPPWRTP